MTAWSERLIAREIAVNFFQKKHLVVVPNCIWTGYECDLLVVTRNLRLIDVEIKISRADLKADIRKDKWWMSYMKDLKTGLFKSVNPPLQRSWPEKVWKHYYAIPQEVWTDELESSIRPESGVLLLYRGNYNEVRMSSWRRATSNKNAEQISPGSAIDIARLASLRMWDAYLKTEVMK